ncbi:MAG: hypothetical protein R3F59_13060 [Myxococcota bacterium]
MGTLALRGDDPFEGRRLGRLADEALSAPLFFERTLAEAVQAEGFTGIRFVEIADAGDVSKF